jgi:hypothetical protein
MTDFLKLPRAAQKAAFAHMGERRHPGNRRGADRGRIAGFVGELPTPRKPAAGGRGRFAGELPAGRFAGQLPAMPKQEQRALGTGARHQKLAKQAERQAPGMKQVDDLRAAYEKGHTRGESLSGGNWAQLVQKVKLSDGRQAVRKRQTAEETRAEYLGGRVANALGIGDLTVAQVSDRDTVMNFVDGETGAALMKALIRNVKGDHNKRPIIEAERDRQMQLRNAREIGMLDWLIDNDDRHELNWMVSKDGKSVIPIDHAAANFVHTPHGKTGRHKVPRSPFVDAWVRPKMEGYREFVGADPQWTPAELAKIRASIEALRPEFSSAEEKRWFDAMITRLDMLNAGKSEAAA